MKLRVALLAVLVTALTASLASAAFADRHQRANNNNAATPTTTTTTTTPATARTCGPIVSLIMRGKLVSTAADGTSLIMSVNRTNWHARWYKGLTVLVRVAKKARIWLDGKSVVLSALSAGDKINVQARACRQRALAAAPPLAIRIVASSPKPAPPTTTTTTTPTTTTTTTPATARTCGPIVSLIMRGKLVSTAADGTSLIMSVNRTNWHARWYKGLTVLVRVAKKARIWLDGKSVVLSALSAGDKINVQARACRQRALAAAPPLAIRIVASSPKPAPPTTTTTTTSS